MIRSGSILDKIVENKKREIKGKVITKITRKTPIRDFAAVLKKVDLSIIAEIKKASPSEGLIRQNFDYLKIAKDYERSKLVDAISCLTEQKYFQGELEFIARIREEITLPVLRKDFIFSEYQVYESLVVEADAILLIAAILDQKELKRLISLAESLGLYVLVETHNQEEIKRAIEADAKIIGINARDLKTFRIDNSLFGRLTSLIPDNVIKVAESGLNSRKDLEWVKNLGADAALIGTSIMKADNIVEKLKELKNG